MKELAKERVARALFRSGKSSDPLFLLLGDQMLDGFGKTDSGEGGGKKEGSKLQWMMW